MYEAGLVNSEDKEKAVSSALEIGKSSTGQTKNPVNTESNNV
jgi:hypothetical protein